jgi:hypothetical protein
MSITCINFRRFDIVMLFKPYLTPGAYNFGGQNAPCLLKREPPDRLTSGGNSNSEAERAERARPREEASGRSGVTTREHREREGAFGITAGVRYSLVTTHYR